jgi:hypothetical protein
MFPLLGLPTVQSYECDDDPSEMVRDASGRSTPELLGTRDDGCQLAERYAHGNLKLHRPQEASKEHTLLQSARVNRASTVAFILLRGFFGKVTSFSINTFFNAS